MRPAAAASDPIEFKRVKAIFVGSIGNLVEWYDFYCYAAFSLYFASSFFPSSDPVAQSLSTAAIFALGFFIRPIGGLLFGYIGDRHGRRRALMLSVLLMCGGSLMIACAPTYAAVGVWAPILLLVARLLQGLSLGGEYGSSATYLSEMATSRHRGFYSSFQYVTLIGGQLTALVVLLVLQNFVLDAAELKAWAGASRSSSVPPWPWWPSSCGRTCPRRRPSRSSAARARTAWAASSCCCSTRASV